MIHIKYTFPPEIYQVKMVIRQK